MTLDELPAPAGAPRKRLVPLAGGLVVTVLLATLAFWLGAWGFDTRRFTQHEGRLSRLLQRQPRLQPVVQALEDEGARLLAAPSDERELAEVAARHGGPRSAEILEKGRRWPTTRVFAASDMIYVLFFDEAGVMRDFTLVSR
jgi:hypothetical protein